ncbi:LURP-one-related/scramblase family protein [Anaerovirgula multivorans]|nr:hypothetical protein [Anaerovirgula multivorans]
MKKEFAFFKPRFVIESTIGNCTMEGNILSHNFEIHKGNKMVATVNKKWFAFADTYGADIADDEDQPFILALVSVIDQVLHDNNHNNS